MSTSRRFARELALQTLYGTEVGHRAPEDMLGETTARIDGAEGRAFVKDLVFGTLEFADESDALIAPLLEGWTIERLPTIDRIVLRMGVFERSGRASEEILDRRFGTVRQRRAVAGGAWRVARPAHARAAKPVRSARPARLAASRWSRSSCSS